MMTVSIIAGWYVLSGAYCALMFSGTAIAEWYVIYYPLKQHPGILLVRNYTVT